MNISPETPDIPTDKTTRKSAQSLEEMLNKLKPQLDRLPADQRLLPLPPDSEMVAEVREYIQSLGLVPPPVLPPTIGIGGEFLDPAKLCEGRVGLHKGIRVAAFLYRYPDKILRAVIIFPRDGVDVRMIGLAILLREVADIPETLVQTEIVTVQQFFAICAFDLSKLIDVPALERFKAEYKKQMDSECEVVIQRRNSAERLVARLEAEKSTISNQQKAFQAAMIAENSRAEWWRLLALAGFAGTPLTYMFLRWLGL